MLDHVRHERVVLSGMLSDAVALQDGLSLLESSDFQLHSHQIIFEAMAALQADSQPVEPLALSHLLRSRKQEETVGAGYVVQLLEDSIRNRDIRAYANQVKEFSALRRVAGLCERVMREALEGDRSSGELIAALETSIAGIQVTTQRDEMDEIADVMPVVVDRILHPELRAPALPTGIPRIDEMTLGRIRPGELWVWGGLPGRGKSAVGRQVARSIAGRGEGADIFTIEMPKEDWAELDLAAEAGVPHFKTRGQVLDRDDRGKLIATASRMSGWKVRYEDCGALHLRTLIAKARISVMRRGTKLIVVDYVQRVKTDDRDIRIRVGNVAEALAEFAKEYKCAVVLLSQLARRGDVNARPSMQDLKEAGELEAHAHTVLLNFRPVDKSESDEEKDQFTGEDEIIIAKQRFGPIGIARVAYDPWLLKFNTRQH